MSCGKRYIPKVRIRQVREGRLRIHADTVNGPKDVFKTVYPVYKGRDREILSVVCLDAQNKPVNFHMVSMGGLNTTRARPADILKIVLLSNALGFLLVHNHPSGVLEPSQEDIEFTTAVTKACDLLGIELYDHLIVTDDGYTSLRERGLL